jgi:hypothetical protein
MRAHVLFIAAAVILTSARADIRAVPEACPNPAGTWSFQEVLIAVVESLQAKLVPVLNQPEPQVIMHQCFSDAQTCGNARLVLNAFGVSLPLGTGGGAQAHLGRTVSDCFQR